MSEASWHKWGAMAGLGVAAALLVVGGTRSYEVEPSAEVVQTAETPSPPAWALPSFAPGAQMPPPPPPPPPVAEAPVASQLSDLKLIENTTFTGVVRKEGRLYYTYDPRQARGKRSCPT